MGSLELNLYFYIILTAIVVRFLLNLVSEFLNLGALKPELPKEFHDTFDAEKYAKSQEYTKEKTRFELLVSSFDLLVLIGFWFAGGFGFVDETVRSFGFSASISGLIFIGALVSASGVISFPFSYYSTFVIEEKYGFNKQTKALFFIDRIKGVALGVIIGAPVLYGVLWFFNSAGAFSWLYVWTMITLVSLALQYIAPTWIMPLFNKFTPLEEGSLKQKIIDYASSVQFPLADVFVIDGSKRSTKSNAFFTGFGKNKRIALFDTLIEKHSEEELVSVLAHEVGHFKKKHVIKGTAISIIQTGVILYLLSFFLGNQALFSAFGVKEVSVYGGLLFFMMLFQPVQLGLSIFFQILSRRHEFEADHFAAETIGSCEPLIGALKKLSADNLSNLTPHPFYTFLHYSHPPVLQRIEALRK